AADHTQTPRRDRTPAPLPATAAWRTRPARLIGRRRELAHPGARPAPGRARPALPTACDTAFHARRTHDLEPGLGHAAQAGSANAPHPVAQVFEIDVRTPLTLGDDAGRDRRANASNRFELGLRSHIGIERPCLGERGEPRE